MSANISVVARFWHGPGAILVPCLAILVAERIDRTRSVDDRKGQNMTIERESSSRLVTALGNCWVSRSPAPGLNWARFARGLKWLLVLLVVTLIVLGLVAPPVVKRPDLLSLAGPFLAEAVDPGLRPVAYLGADLAWAELGQAKLLAADMQRAVLIGADLSRADLRRAHLDSASLLGANLSRASLEGATLSRADLHWAHLNDADLSGTDLRQANLKGANLEYANLSGASLIHTNLRMAHLRGATLPDGSRWMPSSDLARFTDPAHPDFWSVEGCDTAVFSMRHLPEFSVVR